MYHEGVLSVNKVCFKYHYSDIIMGPMASQITTLTTVLLNGLFRLRPKKTSKLRVTDLCEGNSPVTGEFTGQRASDAENVSIWRRHHALLKCTPEYDNDAIELCIKRWMSIECAFVDAKV